MNSAFFKKNRKDIKPFLSIVIMICTLFFIAFLHMEERRLGYQIYYLSQQNKKIEIERKVKEIELARLAIPSQIMSFAKNKLTLRSPELNQIIHLASPTPQSGIKGKSFD
ncbi:MAG: cell division protein FtsL [Bdellovibrionaceae bacterium]|nr:cell division protein FtsL [Pseudobdellovibrionaceae bacterium]